MRIISLNTWGGRAGKEGLLSFFKKHADTTDIFCLQEIWSAAYDHLDGHLAGGVAIDNSKIMTRGLQEISEALPNHETFFTPLVDDNYGLLMLIHKTYRVLKRGEFFVYKQRGYISTVDVGDHARPIQYVTALLNNRPITVINFHGLWNGKDKGDSADRLEQSKKILEFMKNLRTPFILCGDFNLLPDTESIKMFEDAGLRNLIREFGVTSTRTSFYTKSEDKHANYTFISGDVELKDFKVLPDEVSDHAPLLIEVQ
ncbi:MAG: endonuclease/exonuclease/phosphatase family protein [Patescibacteria group bacterium]